MITGKALTPKTKHSTLVPQFKGIKLRDFNINTFRGSIIDEFLLREALAFGSPKSGFGYL